MHFSGLKYSHGYLFIYLLKHQEKEESTRSGLTKNGFTVKSVVFMFKLSPFQLLNNNAVAKDVIEKNWNTADLVLIV